MSENVPLEPKLVICDVTALTEPDLETVDVLARLELIARRQGARLLLIHAHEDLCRLLAFSGLRDAVLIDAALALELQRKPEEWEQVRGVEEEAGPRDPPV